MKSSPLHNRHQACGAIFETSGEWEIPSHYGHQVREYQMARQAVGMADLSHRGTCLVTGEDRVPWLHSIVSQNILTLQPGEGSLSTFMNHKGKILAYFRIYMREDRLFLEDVGEAADHTFQALRKFLLYGTKAKLHNGLGTWGIILITGPQSMEVLRQGLGVNPEGLLDLQSLPFAFQDSTGFVAKTQETQSLDYEIFIPIEALTKIWERLSAIVQDMGGSYLGHRTLETLRIEAGLARLGPDVNEQIVPPEANMEGKTFSLSKGCYPGQEVVARMDTYGSVKRRLVGLVINSSENIIPEHGSKIFSGTREVGWISSATYSPVLGKPIALGFPLRDFTQPNTPLEIETAGTKIPASVSSLPFAKEP
ncbi:MAG: aminomethyltransferase family protein [Nitrospira sp.]|nr:aminomethyltransferase family protein [Nitrospira sp.]MCA9476309.1 aminomethyltransferase family protein [Nitrospira sp.]MCA9479001.1 aminomethyltransferase family protein [Nitrospira sp.]MCB9710695.1 aminomethyl transferase family protein [Nitrospiraceae bacterium]MDR4487718.1 aminomethyltransferase family protein [Nitrospirales bacterium]